MAEDLRPVPRLPLDTAQTEVNPSNGLNVFTVEEPGESIVQVSLIETPTPNYNAFVGYAQTAYHWPIEQLFPDVNSALLEAEEVTSQWVEGPGIP
jgi:hypothetical protein